MNLRRRAFLVLALTATILIAALELIARSTVADSFEKVEKDLVTRDLQRAKDALAQRVMDLRSKALDWSHWDDLWRYMAKPSKAFETSNLQDNAAQILDLDLILLFSNSGKTAFAISIDNSTGHKVALPPQLSEVLRKEKLLELDAEDRPIKSGIQTVGTRALMFTAQPILRSDGSGPRRGVILMGRWIDEGEMRAIARTTHLTMSGFSYASSSMPRDQALLRRLRDGNGTEFIAEDDATCRGYVRIDDLAGRPNMLVVLRSQRDVYAQGRKTLLWLVGAILVVGLALATVIWVTLERTVLHRLQVLSRQVADITVGNSDENRVDEGTPDELGRLAHGINTMLSAQEESRLQIERANEALRTSEERLDLAIKGSNATIWDWNIGTGEVYASAGLRELLGYADGEFPGNMEAFLSRIHPLDRPRWNEASEAHLELREPFDLELRVASARDQYRWLHTTGQAVWDENGRPVRMVGSNIDIGKRKEAEAELRKFFLLVENNEDFVAMAWLDGTIAYVNAAGRRLVGMDPDEPASSKVLLDLFPENLHLYVSDVMLPETISHGAWEGETRFRRLPSGDEIVMHERVFMVSDPATAEPLCFATVARDITAARKAEEALAQARDQALASTRAKATFLANMSHEIRTPMNGVIGMTELLFDTDLSDEQRDYAGIIRTSAESLLAVINDILDFSKIEAGKMQIEEIDFNLRSVLEEVSFLLASRAHAKKLELVCHVPPGLPEELCGDPTRIRQIAMNLLGNAIKFTERGEVVLEASVLKESRKEALICIGVRDTGIGIPKDRLHAVFDSFTQADGSSSRRYGGTGLGLTICKQLTDLMRGEISVESTLGKGSTFSVALPLKKQSSALDESRPTIERLGGVRTLIVDDNPTNRLILREYLKAWGCRSSEAEGGRAALELMRAAADREPFHVVLLDMQMPEMDGEETAKLIRADSRFKDVGIVLLTSMGSVGTTSQAQAMGFDATLVKPVHQSQLYNALAGILDRDADTAGTDRKLVDASSALEGIAILLVEDNTVNQKVASRILARFGCTVAVANNGVEALETLSNGSYDLVLMDCQMPEMDGYEATHEIRRREVGTKRHQPIVAMTAGALEGDRDKCLACGMDGYVAKPVKPQELLESILPWVGRSVEHNPRPPQVLQVLDAGRLTEVCGDDDEFLAEVIAEFLCGIEPQLAEMRAAIERGDSAALASFSHGLKGSARTMGGMAAASVCEELEICGRQGVQAGIEEIFVRAEAQLESLRQSLLAILKPKAA